jgi:hypothetical protein
MLGYIYFWPNIVLLFCDNGTRLLGEAYGKKMLGYLENFIYDSNLQNQTIHTGKHY